MVYEGTFFVLFWGIESGGGPYERRRGWAQGEVAGAISFRKDSLRTRVVVVTFVARKREGHGGEGHFLCSGGQTRDLEKGLRYV